MYMYVYIYTNCNPTLPCTGENASATVASPARPAAPRRRRLRPSTRSAPCQVL